MNTILNVPRIPGAIQSFGFLVALRLEDAERLQVRIVSENCLSICGYTAQALFALSTFQSLFPEHQQSLFITYIRKIHTNYLLIGKSEEPKVVMVSFISPNGNALPFCCAAHFVGGTQNLFVCEFEPLQLQSLGDDMPTTPVNALGRQLSDPTALQSAELDKESGLIEKIAKELDSIEDTSLEVVAVLSQIHSRFAAATTVPALLQVVVHIIQDLSNFHRVMVYEFDQSFNGSVVAELLDPRASIDSYQGLHFPATDIPKQARDLVRGEMTPS
jgi:light-regulated signal transduction histidine kinase (bacteriophytochrome)